MSEHAIQSSIDPRAGRGPAVPLHVLSAGRPPLRQDLRELWAYRELLGFLTWRDVKVRYRQTVLGAAWAVIQPLATMVVFSVIFGRLAGLPSEGQPYPVFTFAALLPWTLFSSVLTRMSASVVGNASLVSKIYFPRVLIPLASIGAACLDFLVALGVLLLMMVYFDVPLTLRSLAVLPLTVLVLATASAAGLFLAAVNVRYRDVAYVLPFFVQLWQFVSPVAYSTTVVATVVAPKWLWLYELNPLVGAIEGFRWALLGTAWPAGPAVGASVGVTLLALGIGFAYFRRTERGFADVV